MKHFLIALLLMVVALPALSADNISTVDDAKTRKNTPDDCLRVVENGKQVIKLRDDGVGLATVTASMLRKNLLQDDQYRTTLPLLLNFASQAYGRGKLLPGKDLVTALNMTCHSETNGDWVYF